MGKLVNRARMTTATTGTGTITLGSAVSGYADFATAGVANADVVSYCIEDGTSWELGTGTYTSAGTTLTRTVTLSSAGGTTALTLSGSAQVFVTALAADLFPVPAANGGTGFTSYTIGDVLYASGTSALSKLADVATGSALISGGVGVAPSWGKIGLTTHVSGTLAATSGGTGLATYAVGDLLQGGASNTLAALAAVATGNVLISGGVTTASSWGKVGLTTHVSGTLAVGNGGIGVATITGIMKGNGTSAVTAATAGTDYMGITTANALTGSGGVSVNGTGTLGYGTGAGGTVTQLTSKITGVTLNKITGRITMNGALLGAGGFASFPVTNSLVAVTDTVIVGVSGGYFDSTVYTTTVCSVNAGNFVIQVNNNTTGPLSEALVVNFTVIKGASA